MRLIDADKLNFEKLQDTNDKAIPANEYIAFLKGAIAAQEIIENAPTIDAEPVVYGHWDIVDNRRSYKILQCSKCLHARCLDKDEKNPDWCEICGAKMDEEAEQE